ncbi:MAG: hypothetical protein KKG60_04030 [Nanoarchaeota archaeon]|nr:hypothetical protein [Nanoarchaeota archaeon]
MGVDISTAVDSLVRLVKKKGIIQINDAAKELSIPASIVNEWAVFLEEEGIIEIEYRFTTPYLSYKPKGECYKEQKELIKKKLSLLLLSVRGKVPKTKQGVMQRNFLVGSIMGLIKETDNLSPLNKNKVLDGIKKTLHRKILFEETLRSGG